MVKSLWKRGLPLLMSQLVILAVIAVPAFAGVNAAPVRVLNAPNITFANPTAATNSIMPPGQATVPTVNNAATDNTGATVILNFNEEMSSPPPGAAGFTVTVNGANDAVTANNLESNTYKIDLTLSTAVQYGDQVGLSYAGTSVMSISIPESIVNGLQTYGEYMLQPFSGLTVTNNVPARITTPPLRFSNSSLNNVSNNLLNSSTPTAYSNSQGITVSVNGTLVQFDVAPMVIDGRVMVQMRPIFEALGATVEWNDTDNIKTVTATKGSTTLVLQIGSYTATVNGKTVTLVTPPLIINQHTMVPVRFVSDFLGYKVTWDAAGRQVDITSS
jgi:uncharacterized repeat protein (TIGR02059 family)